MWWIIIIAIIGFVIYRINKEHKEHVGTHVTNYGGMTGKYGMVINYLKSGGQTIQKITKDSVVLVSKNMTWTLDYVGFNLEFKVKGFMPMLGNIDKKWIFPDKYPQEKIVEEVENYLNWQMERLKDITKNF